jgi:hypothetical protein
MRCLRHPQEAGNVYKVHSIHGPATHANKQEQKSHVRDQRPNWCEPQQYGAPKWCGRVAALTEEGRWWMQAADCSYTGWKEETRRGCANGKVVPICRQGLEPPKTTGAYLSLLSAATDNAYRVHLPARADGRPYVRT